MADSFMKRRAILTAMVLGWMTSIPTAVGQSTVECHRILQVSVSDPVVLDIDLPKGELQVLYSRDGQVSFEATAQGPASTELNDEFFNAVLHLEQTGNRIRIRHLANPGYVESGIRVVYRIDVPYRTAVTARIESGSQIISGIMGPVNAVTGTGDIKASYVSKGLRAEAKIGNLDLDVVGEHVNAVTGHGNISCARAAQGVSAETKEGDITLMMVGDSVATVTSGNGRIDLGGVRGDMTASTAAGDLRVKAAPHGNWHLSSGAGAIRIELPPAAQFDLDASTESGTIAANRNDVRAVDPERHHLEQKINGGGSMIQLRSERGEIAIQ